MFEVYKRGQGKYTRVGTIVGVMIIVVTGARALSEVLGGSAMKFVAAPMFRFGLPSLITVVIGLLTAWIVNRPKAADFLIATEGEMKKVSWSNRREVIGSTKVVIVTAFIMAGVLFAMDVLLTFLFHRLGILGGQAS